MKRTDRPLPVARFPRASRWKTRATGEKASIPVSRLKKERYQIGIVLFFEPWQGSKVRCLRSAPVRAVRGPPDLVRRLALLLFIAEALILQGFRSFYVVADLHPPAPSRFIVSAIMLFLINSVSPLLLPWSPKLPENIRK